VALIWFEIWGSWIWVLKNSIFPGKFLKTFEFFKQFHKNFDFSRQISEKFRFFQAILVKKFDFPGKNWPFTSYFWANYSISLRKSAL